MKTNELTGTALDWAVATCEGFTDYDHYTETMMPPRKGYGRVYMDEYSYSTDWARGGPIIEKERIQLRGSFPEEAPDWTASLWCNNTTIQEDGPTPLIAAMRCYVASKLGEDVDVPEEIK